MLFWYGKVVKVEVIGETNCCEKRSPSWDGSFVLASCFCCCRCCLGNLSRREESQDCISLGTSEIVKPAGVCSGKIEIRREHRSVLDELWSLDKASAMLLRSPGNHWEYKQVLESIIRVASFLATVNRLDDSVGCNESRKFDFLSHPAARVLSVVILCNQVFGWTCCKFQSILRWWRQ